MTEPSDTSEIIRPSTAPVRRIRLRITIPLALFLMMGLLSALLFGLHYTVTSRIVRDFAHVLLDPVASVVTERARDFLHEVERAAELGADIASDSNGEMEDLRRLEALEMSILRTHPGLAYMQFGDVSGRFLLVERSPAGGLDSQEISNPAANMLLWHRRDPGQTLDQFREESAPNAEHYDPRNRPWFQGAAKQSSIYWTDPYVHLTNRSPVLTAARASRNGKVISAATISLDGLSSFLRTIELHGRVVNTVIAEADGTIIATSDGVELISRPDGRFFLPRLGSSNGRLLQELAQHPEIALAVKQSKEISFAMQAPDGKYLGVLQRLPVAEGRTWFVIAMVPEAPYLGQIQSGFVTSAIAALVIIVVFIFIAMMLSRTVVNPLHEIAVETQHIRKLSFDDRPLVRSRFEEIAEITDAYKSLKRGLRALEKYVPLKLVRTLLENNEEPVLGGRTEELTIFFTDVRGFSTFSEKMTPESLAEMLGQYLQTMTNVVSAESGTVDKFIGDAVMAFWNAPRPVDDHAYRAALAALKCQEAVAQLKDAELLFTRIGIHTGRVMVGNFGASERMSYTVLGDSVNLAARLEGVNKEYGTRILISETTFAQIRGRLFCRRLDRIAVKGKSQSTDIYEVLGVEEKISASAREAATTYEAALEAYFSRDFGRAQELFDMALEQRPDDKAADLMLKRCAHYAAHPPPADWTGVSAMESK